jgi:hypothetical protein
MTTADYGLRERAEIRAAKKQERAETVAAELVEQARKGGEARAAYDAARQATEDKTVRLKALRLAKEKAA